MEYQVLEVSFVGLLLVILQIFNKLEHRLTTIETMIRQTHVEQITEIKRRITDLEEGKKSIERWIHDDNK